jgi:DNA ligase (NAD+)
MILCLGVFVGMCTGASGAAEGEADRVQWLRTEIARHDDLYFKKAAPEISDAEYDALKRELRVLEKNAPQAVGDDRSGDWPVRMHRVPMLSLEKAYSQAELRAFIEKTERALRREDLVWVLEPKYDGMAISVTYEGRKLTSAVTRGDGVSGDEVTANFLTIAGVPKTLPAGAPDLVEIRGEIFMEWAEFRRINGERTEAGEAELAHPRNVAAGTMKSKDGDEVARRKLSVVFYATGAWEGEMKPPRTQLELPALLKAWGLPGVDAVGVRTTDVWAAVEEFGRGRARLDFPTDGVVLKVNSLAEQRELGASEAAPRWAVAYKFAPERVTTRVKAITLQVGRTGVITPVAELEPVKVGGTTVMRATLHNADEIARRDVRVGDYVFVEKAGEIIPAITGVDESRRGADVGVFVFPDTCVECGAGLVRDGAAVRCPNTGCPAQVARRVAFFASRSGVGIRGLGPALIERLVADGKVKGVADVYGLTRADVPERVLVEIERSRVAELGKLLAGLGVGKKRAAELMSTYGDLRAMSDELGDEARALVALGVNPPSLRENP